MLIINITVAQIEKKEEAIFHAIFHKKKTSVVNFNIMVTLRGFNCALSL